MALRYVIDNERRLVVVVGSVPPCSIRTLEEQFISLGAVVRDRDITPVITITT